MASRSALFELVRVRVLLFLREPEALFWVFIFPVLMAAALGFAFQGGEAPTARVRVLDGDGAAALVERLSKAPGVPLELEIAPQEEEPELRRAITSGRIDVLLLPGDDLELIFDGQRPEGAAARTAVELALARTAPGAPPAEATLAPMRERGSRYVDFLLPGLLGLNLMSTGMWVIGFAVADLRQRKVLKRLLVTPMRRSSFLLSFLLARLVFLVMEVAALVLFGALVLDVPFRAGYFDFLVLTLLAAFTFAGLGLAVTARAQTLQGASGLLNFAMLPMWLLSGVFFSYERFPEFLHPFLKLIPLSALNDALRATMLEGASLTTLLPELAILAAWAAAAFVVALTCFRWR